MHEIELTQIKCDLVPTDELKVKIEEIASSITEQGLLHPITVHELNTSPMSYEVVAGKKRFLAYKSLEKSSIICEVKKNLDDLQKEELSLHENLRRGQLPWYEEVTLIQRLHDLRLKQHGQAEAKRPESGKKIGWGMRDTARELGKALGGVSEDLHLAKMVQINPALRNIKDKATAIKVVRQEAQRQMAEEEQFISGSQKCADEIYLGDAAAILDQFPETIFDVCITDPPWIRFEKVDDRTLTRDEQTLPVFKSLFRCMKFDSFLYMTVSLDDFIFYRKKLSEIGWKIQAHPCIWVKESGLTRTGVKGWEHGRDLEMILVAVKGSPVLASSTQVSSIFRHAVVPSKLLIHPNEKPTALISAILDVSSYEGSLAIDPFAGSGVLAIACMNRKRHYTLIEREPERYKKIMERVNRRKEINK